MRVLAHDQHYTDFLCSNNNVVLRYVDNNIYIVYIPCQMFEEHEVPIICDSSLPTQAMFGFTYHGHWLGYPCLSYKALFSIFDHSLLTIIRTKNHYYLSLFCYCCWHPWSASVINSCCQFSFIMHYGSPFWSSIIICVHRDS